MTGCAIDGGAVEFVTWAAFMSMEKTPMKRCWRKSLEGVDGSEGGLDPIAQTTPAAVESTSSERAPFAHDVAFPNCNSALNKVEEMLFARTVICGPSYISGRACVLAVSADFFHSGMGTKRIGTRR